MRNLIECNNVIPTIFIVSENTPIEKYIAECAELYHVESSYITQVIPEKEELTVDQIKELSQLTRYSSTHPSLIALVGLDRSSAEVQNMLLKTLEEISERYYFILFVRTLDSVFPTIRSRCTITNNIKHSNHLFEKRIDIDGAEYFSLHSNSDISREEAIKKIDTFLQTAIVNSLDTISHILHTRSLIQNNNVDPAMGLDNILLFFQKHSIIKNT